MKFLKTFTRYASLFIITLTFGQCMNTNTKEANKYNILFLHHSTGSIIYEGGGRSFQILGHNIFRSKPEVPKWFVKYNKSHGTSYQITEQSFPKAKPYGWSNDPHDYYAIWVKNAGNQPFMEEPTLEMLTKQYNMIILKHCFPVGDIVEDINKPDIDSPERRMENYKLQYLALKEKMLQFPDTKFIFWTGAVRIESETNPASAARAKAFFSWVKNEWDTENDNIYLFDFEQLETDGGLYLKKEYASTAGDSHPGKAFASKAATLFCQRIVDIIENDGTKTKLTGDFK
jgi:hypothetical protein